ncbi:uncharacterized protein [Dermacentor andersoni]|uniref:uncharacterized protein n=1 Tax=Dermacentor andersoni TaxID=34620 RepID=UPI002155AA51|nr:iroquois-class homeodomain protein IRX-6-like [Dermacentor andersoni]
MSYGQFGYSSSSQLMGGGGSGHSPSPATAACCEPARPLVGESPGAAPVTAASGPVCSLPAAGSYDSRLLSSYPQLATPRFYNAGYGDQAAAAADYANLAVDSSAFYPTLNPAYTMKEAADPWRGITQPASYYYDPALAAYGYGGLDFNGARRKNVTRDSTSTLKAWLNEHRKNPYPTKGEKIMLAIITKMTLTQVSTWFANARRRLKKENKMTWEPRNKADADDSGAEDKKDDEDTLDERTASVQDPMRRSDSTRSYCSLSALQRSRESTLRPPQTSAEVDHEAAEMQSSQPHRANAGSDLHQQRHSYGHSANPYALGGTSRSPILNGIMSLAPPNSLTGYTPAASSDSPSPDLQGLESLMSKSSPNAADDSSGADSAHNKPKIWSLADTATSKSPPPPLPCSGQTQGPPASGGQPKDTAGGAASHGSVLGWFSGGYHHRAGGGNTPTSAAAAAAAAHFASYGSNGFSPGGAAPQTDTPPQTPPNAKMGATGSSSLPFHLGSGGYFQGQSSASHLYLGQASASAPHSHMGVDKSSSSCAGGPIYRAAGGYASSAPAAIMAAAAGSPCADGASSSSRSSSSEDEFAPPQHYGPAAAVPGAMADGLP